MKTTEEIKHALECCNKSECHYCPYCLHESDLECNGEMAKDALHLINLLERDVKFYQHLYNIQGETIQYHEQYERQLEQCIGSEGKTFPEWISVEENHPALVIAPCLICANGQIEIADWSHDKYGNDWWFYVDGEYEIGVTHWMPLPEQPKED